MLKCAKNIFAIAPRAAKDYQDSKDPIFQMHNLAYERLTMHNFTYYAGSCANAQLGDRS